ncbi:hypothetical protein SDC9_152453 [bioreactor metagenome]|uniref:Uncharacterized protein n=1 Tax=bioreactor metagenome TaxID=1076179 RepID=A0A645EXI0_9ZZZZ
MLGRGDKAKAAYNQKAARQIAGRACPRNLCKVKQPFQLFVKRCAQDQHQLCSRVKLARFNRAGGIAARFVLRANFFARRAPHLGIPAAAKHCGAVIETVPRQGNKGGNFTAARARTEKVAFALSGRRGAAQGCPSAPAAVGITQKRARDAFTSCALFKEAKNSGLILKSGRAKSKGGFWETAGQRLAPLVFATSANQRPLSFTMRCWVR